MLTASMIVTVTKALAWLLAAIMGVIFIAADSTRRDRGSGRAIDKQKEIARADALGPRDRATVLDRLRDGRF
jgi:hypothetical protein